MKLANRSWYDISIHGIAQHIDEYVNDAIEPLQKEIEELRDRIQELVQEAEDTAAELDATIQQRDDLDARLVELEKEQDGV